MAKFSLKTASVAIAAGVLALGLGAPVAKASPIVANGYLHYSASVTQTIPAPHHTTATQTVVTATEAELYLSAVTQADYENYFGAAAGSANAIFALDSVFLVEGIRGAQTTSSWTDISNPQVATSMITGVWTQEQDAVRRYLLGIDNYVYVNNNNGSAGLDYNGIGFTIQGGQTAIGDWAYGSAEYSISLTGGQPTQTYGQTTVTVPEPSGLALLGFALLALGFVARRSGQSLTGAFSV